jgi:hypothetical protein
MSTNRVRGWVFTALLLGLAAQQTSAQSGARAFRDPSRSYRGGAVVAPTGPPAGVLSLRSSAALDSVLRPLAMVRVDSAPPRTPSTPPRNHLSLTPTMGWDAEQERYGVQLKLRRDGLPFALSVTGQLARDGEAYRERLQVDGEWDILDNAPVLLGRPLFVAALGQLQHTRDVGGAAEFAGEMDVALRGNGADRGTFSLGVLGYADFSWPESGASKAGITLGTQAVWILSDVFEAVAEYDLDSDFNGEDYFATRLLTTLPERSGVKPRLILGVAKHGSVLLGLTLSN